MVIFYISNQIYIFHYIVLFVACGFQIQSFQTEVQCHPRLDIFFYFMRKHKYFDKELFESSVRMGAKVIDYRNIL